MKCGLLNSTVESHSSLKWLQWHAIWDIPEKPQFTRLPNWPKEVDRYSFCSLCQSLKFNKQNKRLAQACHDAIKIFHPIPLPIYYFFFHLFSSVCLLCCRVLCFPSKECLLHCICLCKLCQVDRQSNSDGNGISLLPLLIRISIIARHYRG